MSKYTAEYFASVIKATSIASTLTGKDLFSPASHFRNLILLPSPRPAILRVLRSASRRAYRWCDAERKVGRQPVRVKVGCLSDEKFYRLASGSGQSRSPRWAGQRRIWQCRVLGFSVNRAANNDTAGDVSTCDPKATCFLALSDVALVKDGDPGASDPHRTDRHPKHAQFRKWTYLGGTRLVETRAALIVPLL